MGGPKVDKSAPTPLNFFTELAHPRVPLSLPTTQQRPQTSKENKRRGEKQPTELFAWLVILPQTQGLNDY